MQSRYDVWYDNLTYLYDVTDTHHFYNKLIPLVVCSFATLQEAKEHCATLNAKKGGN